MKIVDIQTSGSDNILRWAIANGASIKNDEALQGMIHNEHFYLITLQGVNELEMFRLCQIYREKLRVRNESPVASPNNKDLMAVFNGSFIPDAEKPDEKAPLYEVASHAINTSINMALQMNADDDIIAPGTSNMFLPMISRKFEVQIPFSFMDLMTVMNEEETNRLFTAEYPATLSEIVENENHSVHMAIKFAFFRNTYTVKYSEQLEKYIRIVKYSALNNFDKDSNNKNKLYKFALLGFRKYDPVLRGECSFSFFKHDPDKLGDILKHMAQLNTPLKLDFVIQLPIHYMFTLQNVYSAEDLPINYDSSMSSVIANGCQFNNFQTFMESDESEDQSDKLKEFENQVDAYKVRIAEATNVTLNALNILFTADDAEVDKTSAFALLPSIYRTNAVITINMDKSEKFYPMSTSNMGVVPNMFSEIFEVIHKIEADLLAAK